jgi:uncharacterized phiE125 gp8 family phage protein
MSLIRITGASGSPVTVEEAKANARVTDDAEDDLVQTLIDAATAHCEMLSGVAIGAQTWELVLDAFPDGDIVVDLGPVTSVTSIKYLDEDGAEQTMSASDYVVDVASRSGRISAPDGWPTASETLNAVRVRFVTGTDAPKDVKQAILLLVTHWYDNRAAVVIGATAVDVPLGVAALLGLHRRMFV